MKLWQKLMMTAAAGAFCLGMSYATPALANQVVQVTPSIEYVKISEQESAFRDRSNGNTMYSIEEIGRNYYIVTSVEQAYKDPFKMEEMWQGFKGSRDVVTNVGYITYCMAHCESGFMEDLAKDCYHEIVDVADGVGELPNHFEKDRIYSEVSGKRYLAATCEISNQPSTSFQVLGGRKWIIATEVRMREEPNTNCNVLGYFNTNEEVHVYGYTDVDFSKPVPNGWAYVRRENGQVGYVSAQFVGRAPIRGM